MAMVMEVIHMHLLILIKKFLIINMRILIKKLKQKILKKIKLMKVRSRKFKGTLRISSKKFKKKWLLLARKIKIRKRNKKIISSKLIMKKKNHDRIFLL